MERNREDYFTYVCSDEWREIEKTILHMYVAMNGEK